MFISTSNALKRELERIKDDFIVCKYVDESGKEIELVIESIGRSKIHGDRDNMSCYCLNLKDGGQGYVKR